MRFTWARWASTLLALGLVGQIAACTKGADPGTKSPPPAPAAPTKSRECEAKTAGWKTTVPDGAGNGRGPVDSRVFVNHQEPCWESLYFGLGSNPRVGYRIRYVERAEVLSDTGDLPVAHVEGATVLRVAILAPVEELAPPKSTVVPPSIGDSVVDSNPVQGSNVLGVWFGGSSMKALQGQTVFYVGLRAKQPLPLRAEGETGPASSLIRIDIKH